MATKHEKVWPRYVISGRPIYGKSFHEGHMHPSRANFAFDQRHVVAPKFLKLWIWRPKLQRYDLLRMKINGREIIKLTDADGKIVIDLEHK